MNWGMMMTDDLKELDDLFAQARSERALSDALAVRIQTDAETERLSLLTKPPTRQSFGVRLSGMLGGWRGMGGLATACAAGVWIGFAAPGFLPDPANYLFDQPDTLILADLDATFLEDTE